MPRGWLGLRLRSKAGVVLSLYECYCCFGWCMITTRRLSSWFSSLVVLVVLHCHHAASTLRFVLSKIITRKWYQAVYLANLLEKTTGTRGN